MCYSSFFASFSAYGESSNQGAVTDGLDVVGQCVAAADLTGESQCFNTGESNHPKRPLDPASDESSSDDSNEGFAHPRPSTSTATSLSPSHHPMASVSFPVMGSYTPVDINPEMSTHQFEEKVGQAYAALSALKDFCLDRINYEAEYKTAFDQLNSQHQSISEFRATLKRAHVQADEYYARKISRLESKNSELSLEVASLTRKLQKCEQKLTKLKQTDQGASARSVSSSKKMSYTECFKQSSNDFAVMQTPRHQPQY